VNPTVIGSVVGGTVYVPEKFGLSCEGSPQVRVGAAEAVIVELELRLKGPHGELVQPDPAPVPETPVSEYPGFAVKVQTPIGVLVA